MTTDSVFLNLPHELLHQILLEVNATDLAALRLSCRTVDRYIKRNELLFKEHYLSRWDEMVGTAMEALGSTWEKRLQSVVWLEKILESDSTDAKLNDYQRVAETIIALLQLQNVEQTRNVEFLTNCFEENKINIDALLCRSSLFEAAGEITHIPADTEFERQLSAKLHCIYGVPIDPRGKKGKPTHPWARSKVYDLRNYDTNTMWGPFRADGSGRVDWEKMEAIMIVLGYNMNILDEETEVSFGTIWAVKFKGSIPYSAPHQKFSPLDEIDPPLEARDPYGVTGTWLRVVCFLDYHDFYAFNFASTPPPEGQPRPPIDIREAIRFIKLGISVTKIEPPGPEDGQELPVVHFKGVSRLIHAFWDPNANSKLTGLIGDSKYLAPDNAANFRYVGSVRLTREGEIRWTSFSIFQG
ncbi:hypothetical protein ABW19_dt0203411 [Dactylella cylindrospora]|nr:hypothetical protein ABW19_dt0203411 [Dactylella cylindrospora]